MSRLRRAAVGLITDVGGSFIVLGATFLAAPLFLRATSQSLYGAWLTMKAILSYFSLADMGVGFALTRSFASLAGKDERRRINEVLATGFWICVGIATLLLAMGYLASFRIPVWLKISASDQYQVTAAFRVLVLAGAIAYSTAAFSGLVVGFQRMATDNILRNISAILGLALSLLLLAAGWQLMALALAALVVSVLVALGSTWLAWQTHPHLSVRPSLVTKSCFGELLKFGGYFQLCRAANTVALGTDSIVISSSLGASSVPRYDFTTRLPSLFSVTVASKMPGAVLPAMVQMYTDSDTVSFRRSFIRLSSYATRLALVGASLTALCNQEFVRLWVGSDQYGGNWLTLVLCCLVVQDAIFRGTSSAIYAVGELRVWSMACVAEAVLNLFFSLWLVGKLGLPGVALGTVMAKFLTTAWVLPLLVCKKINLSIAEYLKAGILIPMLSCLPGVILTVACAQFRSTGYEWLYLVILGVVAVFGNIACFEGRAKVSAFYSTRVAKRNLAQ